MLRITAKTALLLLAWALHPGAAGADEWTISGAVVRVDANEQLLGFMGVGVQSKAAATEAGLYTLFARGSVRFFGEGPGFRHLLDGALTFDDGLRLNTPAGILDLADARLVPVPETHDFRIVDANDRLLFTLSQSHTFLDPTSGELSFGDMDMVVSKPLARRLGDARYAGITVAGVHIEASTNLPRIGLPKGAAVCGEVGAGQTCTYTPPGGGNVIDVALTVLSGLSQADRLGDRISAAPNARLENFGTADVLWCQAISPDSPVGPHPFLVMNVYRVLDNEVVQIGRSDVKHAFFATNDSCSCAGDQILFAGCGDVYGVFSNTDDKFLAPRNEVNPFTGEWAPAGSHFDGAPVDSQRDHGRGDHDDLEHRLTLSDADLSVAGAEYFMEAWYVVADDVDISNNIGHRGIDPSLAGGLWTFSSLGTTSTGPYLDSWVDPDNPPPGSHHAEVLTGQGRVRLAVRITDLGGGQHRYDYALMNLDHAAGVESFELNVPSPVTISDPGFDDGDAGQTDWIVNQDAGGIRWTAPSAAEALGWGLLYRFALTADDDAPFVTNGAELVPVGGGALLPDTLIPGVGIFEDGFQP